MSTVVLLMLYIRKWVIFSSSSDQFLEKRTLDSKIESGNQDKNIKTPDLKRVSMTKLGRTRQGMIMLIFF